MFLRLQMRCLITDVMSRTLRRFRRSVASKALAMSILAILASQAGSTFNAVGCVQEVDWLLPASDCHRVARK